MTRLSQFGGLHFFNPVPVMKLLEVIRMSETSDETFDALLDYGKRVGKTTVKCKVRQSIASINKMHRTRPASWSTACSCRT